MISNETTSSSQSVLRVTDPRFVPFDFKLAQPQIETVNTHFKEGPRTRLEEEHCIYFLQSYRNTKVV